MINPFHSRFDYTFEDYRHLSQNSQEDQLSRMHKVLESCMLSDKTGKIFLELVDEFIKSGGNPNLTFPKIGIGYDSLIDIGDHSFRNVTFFQLVYLYWKNPVWEDWSEEVDLDFQKAIDRMLEDQRTDVWAKFTEHYLYDSEHFFNEKLAAHSDQHKEEGYLLERATIAHYAMTIGDIEVVHKLLQIAPDLLDSTCCMMKGKSLLHQEVISVTSLTNKKKYLTWDYESGEFDSAVEKIQDLDDDETAGEIAQATLYIYFSEEDFTKEGEVAFPVTRITQVSLMHLAARLGNEIACGYFRGRNANFVARDSHNLTPYHYLQLSVSEKFIPAASKRLLKALEPIVRLNRPCLPQTSLHLKREGYHLIYDTRLRATSYTYQRILPRQSLQKNSERSAGGSFKVDREVPKLNRGKSGDYNLSGFDKGHLVPAANATFSDKAMQDTFLFTNACPQYPSFNRGYWKSFESYVRKLADSHDLTEVITGPLFVANNNQVTYLTLGEGQTPVPTHFYKILYLYKGLGKVVKAYIIPHSPIDKKTPYEAFLSTVDKVQELSGTLFNQWRPSSKN